MNRQDLDQEKALQATLRATLSKLSRQQQERLAAEAKERGIDLRSAFNRSDRRDDIQAVIDLAGELSA